jgi:sulfatase maturation enzyme AslB (radical SAM superfamily)
MITGNGEPLLNNNYLRMFGQVNSELDRPFRWIEIQTSGTTLDDEKLRFLRNHVKVNTISLSISSFLSSINASHNQTKRGFEVNISEVCKEIKRYDFNLRLSLNLTKDFESFVPEAIFTHSKDFGADQVTLRVLYQSPNKNTSQDLWIQKNAASSSFIKELKEYIRDNGSPLEVLPFGATKYSLHGMSVVLDNDCMSQEVKDSVKYLILRPNCKLYSRWDDEASLVF